MKILIAEDDFVCCKVMSGNLSKYGECSIVINGNDAIEAVKSALETDNYYTLVCLDIMMPNMSGLEALKEIRKLEEKYGIKPGHGAKIIMTTALADYVNIMKAFKEQCDSYIVKPVSKRDLIDKLNEMGLI